MNHFIKCSDKSVSTGFEIIMVSDEIKKQYLEQSVESGLEVDLENDIYIKEGYGALVGYCPGICNSIDDVLKMTAYDFYRKKVTGKRSLLNILKGDPQLDPYFSYAELVTQGYDLVIGPGGKVNDEEWEKAIYCSNYMDILGADKTEKKSYSHRIR